MKASKQTGTKSSVPSLSLIRFRILRRPPAHSLESRFRRCANLSKKEILIFSFLITLGDSAKSQKPQYRNRNSNAYYLKIAVLSNVVTT